MTVNGKALADTIYDDLRAQLLHMNTKPCLAVVTCAPNFETQRYLALKARKAKEVGVAIRIVEFPADAQTQQLIDAIGQLQKETDGIIVQLPLPRDIDTDAIVAAVSAAYDVDALGYDGTDGAPLPPVVGAIQVIARAHGVSFKDKQVVIVGQGRLVGAPAKVWCQKQGASVTVLTKETADVATYTRNADVLILGAGQPHMIVPNMVKEGVAIFDAGTSEANGVLVGDADPACAQKAALYTPVPGGIGPLTVAILLQNLVTSYRARQ